MSSWGWGTGRQLLACRLSHALGLIVVLGMLWALGWTPAGQTGQGTVAAAPLEPAVLVAVADDMQVDTLLVNGAPTAWRDELLHEQWRDAPGKRWNGIRTPTHKLIRYDNGDEELYDLIADPGELTNLARDSKFAAQRTDLVTRQDALLAR